jgi:hypothetical protein
MDKAKKVTPLELKVMGGIVKSEYNSDGPDASAPVWSWSVAYNCGPGVSKKSVPGVIASLVKKGWAVCDAGETRKDDCVALTDEGFALLAVSGLALPVLRPKYVTHALIIKSLHDAILECTCGGWHYVKTGAMTKAEAEAEHNKHAPLECHGETKQTAA